MLVPTPVGPCQRAHSRPVMASHTRIWEGRPSAPETAASRVPSGLKVTPGDTMAGIGWVVSTFRPVAISQMHTVIVAELAYQSPRFDVAATRVPSGLRATPE